MSPHAGSARGRCCAEPVRGDGMAGASRVSSRGWFSSVSPRCETVGSPGSAQRLSGFSEPARPTVTPSVWSWEPPSLTRGSGLSSLGLGLEQPQEGLGTQPWRVAVGSGVSQGQRETRGSNFGGHTVASIQPPVKLGTRATRRACGPRETRQPCPWPLPFLPRVTRRLRVGSALRCLRQPPRANPPPLPGDLGTPFYKHSVGETGEARTLQAEGSRAWGREAGTWTGPQRRDRGRAVGPELRYDGLGTPAEVRKGHVPPCRARTAALRCPSGRRLESLPRVDVTG